MKPGPMLMSKYGPMHPCWWEKPLLIQSWCYSCSLLVPPSNLELDIQPKPQFAQNTIVLAEGRDYAATCKTNIGNPLPSTWNHRVSKGLWWNVTGTSSLSLPLVKLIGSIVRSTVTITPDGTHQTLERLSCYADNGIGPPATLTTNFTILSEYIIVCTAVVCCFSYI